MWQFNQHRWTGGQLDRDLMGGQDLSKYFQGATKLENLFVRRQGCISKRRGTNLNSIITNILGYVQAEDESWSVKTINEMRIFPIVYEKDYGFYLLITGGKAFLIGNNGVRLMNGNYTKRILQSFTWTEEVEGSTVTHTQYYNSEDDYNPDTATTPTVPTEQDLRPFYINVPWNDTELNEIGFTQSGDTLFLVHKKHRPQTIVINLNETLTRTPMTFASLKWSRPRITNIEVGSGSTFGSGSLKTVYYVCTYVKDGVESEPSVPYAYAYKTPWQSSCSLVITCDKGNNTDEPDYYNVYKKNSTYYGLIATLGTENTVVAYPTVTKADGTSAVTILGTWRSSAGTTYERLSINDFLNRESTNIGIGMGYLGGTYRPRLCGGIESNTGILLNFGDTSGEVITRFNVGLNCYQGTNKNMASYQTASSYVWWSGEYIKFTVTCQEYNSAGEVSGTHDFTKTIARVNTFGCVVGANYTCSSGGRYTWGIDKGEDGKGNKHPLYSTSEFEAYGNYFGGDNVTADFESDFNTYYGDKTSTASTRAKRFQVKSVKIETFSDSACTQQTTTWVHSFKFTSTYSRNDVFQDDYVNPDVSVTPPSYENHFNETGNYPSCVSIYQQRLCFAATENEPFKFWMSCVGDLYNFDVHESIREDDAISATLDAKEFPQINHILLNKDLLMFSDAGEWVVQPVSGNTLTYKTVSAKMESAIGCSKRLFPIAVGNEIVFAEQTRETLRSIKYSFTSDGYETQDLSVLSSNIFRNNGIVQMAYRQFPDSTIECVLEDGTIASLVYMKEQEVIAWSQQVLGGGWLAKGIATNKALSEGTNNCILIVENNGNWELWNLKDDSPYTTVENCLCVDRYEHLSGAQIQAEYPSGIPTGYVIVNLSTGKEVAYADVQGLVYYGVGIPFTSRMVSVYPEPHGSTDTLQWEVKNLNDARFRIMNGSSFTVRQFGQSDSDAQTITLEPTVSSGYITLCNDDAKISLLGSNGIDGRVDVRHNGYFPFSILSMGLNYETQPLAGSQG